MRKLLEKSIRQERQDFFKERGIKLRVELREDKGLEFIKPGEMDKDK